MTSEELKIIFDRKKHKVEVKTNKKGIEMVVITKGFENTSFEDFERWFSIENFNKGCVYCGTTNEQSLKLYKAQREGLRMDGTRGGKRGKRLEIDRRDPNLPYDNLDNLVWCCYWCNNAKSNFFSEEEFRPIGQAIGNKLKTILQTLNQ